jgi:short-subunit dehydrogenase
MKKAVIVGASSGIGEALARVMAQSGWQLGLAARRQDRLEALCADLPGDHLIALLDVTQTDDARSRLTELLESMGEVDLVVLNAGVGHGNFKLHWDREQTTIDTNVLGFAATANAAFHYFIKQGRGHIVGISSVGKFRGGAFCPAYNASKAFMSNYLEGLRCSSHKRKLNITVTDIRPGFVKTALTDGQKGMFWVAEAEVAAMQIFTAIRKRKARAYITRRWGVVGFFLAHLPDFIYRKI